MSVLILGIGNSLLSDEGAGIHAINYLNRMHPSVPGVSYMDGGTLSFSLAGPIAETDALIVIDATQFDTAAGSVRVLEGKEMDHFLGANRKSSVHEVGLLELLATTEMMGDLPSQRALIGIQPESFDWGEEPSAAVGKAIPEACEQALALVNKWQQGAML